MITWWDSLTELERIFAAIAIPSTIILLLQTVLLLFGIGGGDDGDLSVDNDQDSSGSHDHDPGLRIFTVRGFIAFFCVFGWAGIVFLRSGVSTPVSLIIALVLGFISMVTVAMAILGFTKLQADGTADINRLIGSTATVYISIPAKRKGIGKITAMNGDSLGEYDACTDCDRKLKTNETVTIMSVSGGNKLVVMPK